jgi:hypothetical protein
LTDHPDADPDSDLYFYVDLDPTFNLDADPDPDSSLQLKAQTLECLNTSIFLTIWAGLVICKLMRIRIRFRMQLINVDADPHADSDPQNWYLLTLIIRQVPPAWSFYCTAGRISDT